MLEYYRDPDASPLPATSATALRALRNGDLPSAPFLFLSGSVDTVFSEPLDITLVKELLNRSRLDLSQNRELARVLFRHLDADDRAVAELAARSLSQIESRYQSAINDANKNADRLLEAQLLYDLAVIEEFNPVLQRHFVDRSRAIAADLDRSRDGELAREARILLVRLDLLSRDPESAWSRLGELSIDDVGATIVKAEVAFLRRDFAEVRALMAGIAAAELPFDQEELVAQWTDHEDNQ